MSKKILITGISGLIGGLAAKALSPDHAVHGIGRSPVGEWPYTQADISDFDSMRPAFEGVDTVIHMAASRGQQPFEVHYRANVIGTYNVLEAAKQAGASRVILASSGAVISGYEKDEPYASMVKGDRPRPAGVEMITVDHPLRPRGLYAVTKAWGESLGRAYSESTDLSVLCIRVGKVEIENVPLNRRNATVWCSHRDIIQMIERSVAAPQSLKFGIYFAVSENPLNYRDWSNANVDLGFTPLDSLAHPDFEGTSNGN